MQGPSVVNYSGRGLSKFPKLPTAQNVRELNLSHNKFDVIGELPHNLQCINLSYNLLKSIDSLMSHTNLTSITASHNQIHDLATSTLKCPLTYLDLSFNYLSDQSIAKISHTVCNIIQSLTRLNISSNKITQCLMVLNALPNLQVFKCSFNFIKQITIEKETRLAELDLSFNKISKIDIKELQWGMHSINSNTLVSVRFISKLPNITDISISDNKISEFNIDTSQLHSLKRLSLNKNKLSKIELASHSLETLDISGNSLRELTLVKCPSIKHANISFNFITTMPSIAHTSISKIILKSNQIKSLKPYSDMKAFSLDFVDIASNSLSNSESNRLIYSDLKSRLSEIDISHNPLQSTLPAEKQLSTPLPSGRIYKINQPNAQPINNPKSINIKISLYNGNDIAKNSINKLLSPNNINNSEVPLLLELEQMYQSKYKSNTTNKHRKMNSDAKAIQCFSPLNREQQTPSRAIWSRWGKQRLSIPSPSEIKEFH